MIDGLEADVVTLALAGDIDAIARESKRLPAELAVAPAQQRRALHLDHRVRGAQGKPQGHQGLARPRRRTGVSVVTPNPKTSGGARWNYLAAWAYELDRTKGDQAAARKFVEAIYRERAGARSRRARLDHHLRPARRRRRARSSWENEAFLALQEFGADKFEIVVPAFSILAEPPVSLVDQVVDKRGTRKVAEAYLEFLYTPAAQKIIAQNFYRPSKPDSADPADLARFPRIRLVTVDQAFGGWAKAQAEHFAEGGNVRPDL